MLEANRLVLEELDPRNEGEVSADSRVEGRVAVELGAVISGSIVRGPAIIGRGARITDAFVGPYTSIGSEVEITHSEIENSILLAGARVTDLGTRMEASLLGRNVNLTRSDGVPKTLRMMVGDNSEIELT
jgi:glucose-1-phosphate thymidylyltransferase